MKTRALGRQGLVVSELGIGFVPYSPLGRGFLTGRFRTADDLPADDARRGHPRFQGENFEKNLRLADLVNELARRKGCTPGQLALAWVMAQGEDVVPIPGTKRRGYLEENVRAADITFTADELRTIDKAFPKGVTAGLRYPAQAMAAVNR